MKSILNILTNAWKVMAAVAGFSAIIWGGFRLYYTLVDTQDMVVDVWDNQNLIEANIEEKLNAVDDSLEDIQMHMVKQDQHMKDMEKAAAFYIRNQKEMAEEAMEDALEIMLKKNGDPTVYTGSD